MFLQVGVFKSIRTKQEKKLPLVAVVVVLVPCGVALTAAKASSLSAASVSPSVPDHR